MWRRLVSCSPVLPVLADVVVCPSPRGCRADAGQPPAALLYYLRQMNTRQLRVLSNQSARVVHTVRPSKNGYRVVGRARPVHGSFPELLAAIRGSGPGDVVVVECHGETPGATSQSLVQQWRHAAVGSEFRETLANAATRAGVAGIVFADREPLLLSLFDFLQSRGQANSQVEDPQLIDVEYVALGGISVQPGDYILGDDAGLVVCSEVELQGWLETAGTTDYVKNRLDKLQCSLARQGITCE